MTDSEEVCDLVVAETGVEVEDHGLPEGFGQGSERHLDRGVPAARVPYRLRVGAVRSQPRPEALGIVEGGRVPGLGLGLRRPMLAAAIERDGEHPGEGITIRIEAVDGPVDAVEGLLADILGCLPRAHQAANGAVNPREDAIEELRERGRVALPRPHQQLPGKGVFCRGLAHRRRLTVPCSGHNRRLSSRAGLGTGESDAWWAGRTTMLERSVVEEIRGILEERDLDAKLRRTTRLCADAARVGTATVRYPGAADAPLGAVRPGRPRDWQVVPPATIPDRPKLGDPRGRYQLLHAVANIELAAVELMLMAVADFPGEPREYYQAMLAVAREEVMHTRILARRLRQLGGGFGSEPVHLGLWETAVQWNDLPGRLGVVPRILEARGLDVSGRLRSELAAAGDAASAEVLERIYVEEIGHVGVGTTWYRAACELRGLDPEAHFVDLVHRFLPRRPGRRKIDREGRLAAGFTERELRALTGEDEEEGAQT